MRIEDVEELEALVSGGYSSSEASAFIDKALESLRAEAWYPIERAEEVGAKDGGCVLLYLPKSPELLPRMMWAWWGNITEQWFDFASGEPLHPEDPVTHFRFITTPEAR